MYISAAESLADDLPVMNIKSILEYIHSHPDANKQGQIFDTPTVYTHRVLLHTYSASNVCMYSDCSANSEKISGIGG